MLSVTSNGKYDAEYWVLSGANPRIYVLHFSDRDHAHAQYPRELYEKLEVGRHLDTYDAPYCVGLHLCGSVT